MVIVRVVLYTILHPLTASILLAVNFEFKAYRTILVAAVFWRLVANKIRGKLLGALIGCGSRYAITSQMINSFLLVCRLLTFEGHLTGFRHYEVG